MANKADKPFGTLPPNAKGSFKPFLVHVPDQEIQNLKTLLKTTPVAKLCYENETAERKEDFGVTREWLMKSKSYWEKEFDWRKEEAQLNLYPQFKATICDDDGREVDLHFAAFFSQRKDAVPIVRTHGWPCTFAEFLPVLDAVKERYTPENLPYHFILPSLPGFVFSDQPPLDRPWKCADSARLIHKLMLDLGFASGYIAQGGDIGAMVSRILGTTYAECRAVHLNFCHMFKPDGVDESKFTEIEKRGVGKAEQFIATGSAYARMHGTRPGTIGLVLSSSPVALLAWIGEKYLEWTDKPLPLDVVIREVALYWFTACIPTSIYTYVEEWDVSNEAILHGDEKLYLQKPFGFSYFPEELAPIPIAWAETTGNLVWKSYHESGGHYPALEKPDVLLQDIEGFVKEIQSENKTFP